MSVVMRQYCLMVCLLVVSLFTVCLLAPAAALADWHPVWPGVDNWVYSLGVYDGSCIIGGSFGTAGEITARSITDFDGAAWTSLGSGIHLGMPIAYAQFNGGLIVGGMFPRVGATTDNPDGITASKIAQWDGTSWSALGRGLSGSDQYSVDALTVYNGKLIAGGVFSGAGENSAGNIAQWDGTAWSALGSGMNGYVTAVTTYHGKLIAGGSFSQAGGIAANNIAQWDGTSWSPLDTGLEQGFGGFLAVWALGVYQDQLVAAGIFGQAGGATAKNIAVWDGTSWSPLGAGIAGGTVVDGAVGSLEVYDGKLVAAGLFNKAGGNSANNIAQWDGKTWSTLGLGTDFGVLALKVANGSLFVGGAFTHAGGTLAYSIARWDTLPNAAPGHLPPVSPQPPGNNGSNGVQVGAGSKYTLIAALSAVRTPPLAPATDGRFLTSGGTTIRFQLTQPLPASLTIFGANGRVVRNLLDQVRGPGEYTVQWDGRDNLGSSLPSGIYFCRLSTTELNATGRLLLIR